MSNYPKLTPEYMSAEQELVIAQSKRIAKDQEVTEREGLLLLLSVVASLCAANGLGEQAISVSVASHLNSHPILHPAGSESLH
jgi:hypothetical protein